MADCDKYILFSQFHNCDITSPVTCVNIGRVASVNETRGFRDAPNHPALRAQAEKEAAYRPKAEDGANAGVCGGAEGPSLEKQGNRIISAPPAQGLHGDSSDDDTHLCFAVRMEECSSSLFINVPEIRKPVQTTGRWDSTFDGERQQNAARGTYCSGL